MHCNEALAPQQMWPSLKDAQRLAAQMNLVSLPGGEFSVPPLINKGIIE